MGPLAIGCIIFSCSTLLGLVSLFPSFGSVYSGRQVEHAGRDGSEMSL